MIKQFFEDIHAIRLFLTTGPITVQQTTEDRDTLLDAFINFRRRKPSVKKIKPDFSAAE